MTDGDQTNVDVNTCVQDTDHPTFHTYTSAHGPTSPLRGHTRLPSVPTSSTPNHQGPNRVRLDEKRDCPTRSDLGLSRWKGHTTGTRCTSRRGVRVGTRSVIPGKDDIERCVEGEKHGSDSTLKYEKCVWGQWERQTTIQSDLESPRPFTMGSRNNYSSLYRSFLGLRTLWIPRVRLNKGKRVGKPSLT